MGKAGFTHESQASRSREWFTPDSFFKRLGYPQFDLDPCSPGKDVVPWIPATKHLTLANDGLAYEWEGSVWLNPPYNSELGKWLARLAQHGNGLALVFARTSTKRFQKYVKRADAVCFVEGRIGFIASDGRTNNGAGAGSVLLAFGDKWADLLVKQQLGWTVDNRN